MKLVFLIVIAVLLVGCQSTEESAYIKYEPLYTADNNLVDALKTGDYKSADLYANEYITEIKNVQKLSRDNTSVNYSIPPTRRGNLFSTSAISLIWRPSYSSINTEAVKVLIKNGENPGAFVRWVTKNTNGYMLDGSDLCNREFVSILLANGAKPKDFQKQGFFLATCVHKAAATGEPYKNHSYRIARFSIPSKEAFNVAFANSRSTYTYNEPGYYLLNIKFLLGLGFNANSDIGKGYQGIDLLTGKRGMVYRPGSLLHLAVKYELFDFVYELLKQGANLEVSDSNGETPLFLAYSSGNAAIIQLLLSQGADDNKLSNAGLKPNQPLERERFLAKKLGDLIIDSGKYHQAISQLETGGILNNSEAEMISRLKSQRIIELRKQQETKNSFNWIKTAASLTGFVAGNGFKLPEEEQANILLGIVQDGFSGDESINNTLNAANQVTVNAKSNRQSESPKISSPPTTNSTPALPHYADRMRNANLKSCNLNNVQANSFCQTANVYYSQYLKTHKAGGDTQSIYAIHQRTVRDLADLVKNHKITGAIDTDSKTGTSNLPSYSIPQGNSDDSPITKVCSEPKLQACYKECGPISFDNVECRASCARQFNCR